MTKDMWQIGMAITSGEGPEDIVTDKQLKEIEEKLKIVVVEKLDDWMYHVQLPEILEIIIADQDGYFNFTIGLNSGVIAEITAER